QPPQAATLTALPRDVACAPSSPSVRPTASLTVAAGREAGKGQFGIGDAVVIRGGAAQGVKAGDEYYVRRVIDDRFAEHQPGVYRISVHTAGAVRVLEAQDDASIATVTFACDGVMLGDFLERFELPLGPAGPVGASADYAHPAQLILGAEKRQSAAAGDFMVINRGSDHGVQRGQELTIFRRTLPGGGPVANVGTATVFKVLPESSVVRIESSLDAVYVGDLVAIHR
ncbi:MAG TPA: hypothetical protein VFT47_02030, partial [Vicinamibacterales bacterium]|nr:hypothetical protein [Vicinamibacterales bacterium]